ELADGGSVREDDGGSGNHERNLLMDAAPDCERERDGSRGGAGLKRHAGLASDGANRAANRDVYGLSALRSGKELNRRVILDACDGRLERHAESAGAA